MPTKDLNYLAATTAYAETPLVFDNTVNTGPFKLAQRVITLLFKDKETALSPYLGTDLLNLIRGNVPIEGDLQNQVRIAVDRVREAIQSVETSATPSDERLKNVAAVATVTSNRDGVSISLTVETVSGISASVTVPYRLRET